MSATATAPDAAPPAVLEALAPWADANGVPLPELARRLGLSRNERQAMLTHHLVTPITPRQGAPAVVSHDDAERIVSAALLAAALGLAVIVVLRILAGTGAKVTASGVVLPVPPPP
jgi:hypothetical protein